VPHVVSADFGSEDGAVLERAIDDFCKRRLGAGVAVHEFFYASVGSVHGVRLTDGRRVVVKGKGPRRHVSQIVRPIPHDARFDFERTTQGAEWIDALAVRAKGQLHGSRVLGHCDWRAENMRFLGDEVVAVYDWDSVCCVSEPQLVGSAAHYFTSYSTVEGRRQLPSLDEALAFIDDYEAARGIEFDCGRTPGRSSGARLRHGLRRPMRALGCANGFPVDGLRERT